VLPTVYLADETATVRLTYEAARYPDLPNPAAVARAARKLNDALRPAAVTAADWRLGPDDAAVVLIEYSDYQCGHCMTLHAALRAVEHDLGDRLLVVHRHLPLRATHPLAQLAAEAAESAGAQGHFWAMHDRLFAARGALEREQLIAYAGEIGLDVAQFTVDLDDRRRQEAVNEDFKRAVAAGIKLPPTLFVNGVLYEGPRTPADLAMRIGGLLATPSSS
jgi:protein-disulfide isomerase